MLTSASPRKLETCGYCVTCGRAFMTFTRFWAKVPTPGNFVSNAAKPGICSTDALIGRWLVASESLRTLSGDAMNCRNSHEASTRSGPLSKITQLSGPAIVMWLPPGSNEGICTTPYLTLGNAERSQGPVINMPILPELNRLVYWPESGWKSR